MMLFISLNMVMMQKAPLFASLPKKQKPLLRVAFLLRIALVIPAVETAWLVYLKHSKRCAIFVVFTHTTLTL